MVEVVCDTSFLMILASKNIKNISNLDTEIGAIEFTVPNLVINELERLSNDANLKKKTSAINALEIIKNFKRISISGNNVDDALVLYAKEHHVIIATVDMELKKRVKNFGSIISLSNDKIVLEPSKI